MEKKEMEAREIKLCNCIKPHKFRNDGNGIFCKDCGRPINAETYKNVFGVSEEDCLRTANANANTLTMEEIQTVLWGDVPVT